MATQGEKEMDVTQVSKSPKRKPGGWRVMPFVIGNETFERLAGFGMHANFMVYLLNEYHMDQVVATNVINIWSGTSNFGTLVGAYISDTYLGRFTTLAYASIATFLGMACLALTAAIPKLRPPPCTKLELQRNQCIKPSNFQLGTLYSILALLAVGASGIRPCNLPFGVDQFDPSTEEGRKGITSFFNWYYISLAGVIMISVTVIAYVQDSVSWVIGLGIPAGLMFCGIVMFFIGTPMYVYVPPGGSVFSGIAQVFVAAFKKRHLKLPLEKDLVVYNPPLEGSIIKSKLPLTYQFSYLNKAAVVIDNDVGEDGSPLNKWRLCSVQKIEEVKCLLRIIPIWASGIICFTAITQQGTFTTSQALKMDRHLGPKFQIPPGSLSIISMLTLGISVLFYDRILVPKLRKITKHEGGITILQRMGIGMVFSVLSMVVAGFCETKRRALAISHARPDGIAPVSALWLSPQLALMGIAEGFNVIGQIEFYNKQFPDHMKSIANSLMFCTMSGASYLSSTIVGIVHKHTGKHGGPDWLDKNINMGRVDWFYYLLALMGVFNFVYFLFVASLYQYKREVAADQGGGALVDMEMSATKHAE